MRNYLCRSVYNAADHLQPFLRSVDVQLNELVEVILMDDGSTDNTAAIIKDHITQSPFSCCYIHLSQKNSGVSMARNHAINHATGRYIGFADGDDLLLDGYFGEILQVIDRYCPDLIEIGYKQFRDDRDLYSAKSRFLHKRKGLISIDEIILRVFAANRWFSCLRIYNRTATGDPQYPQNVHFCEDLMTIPFLYIKARNVFHLKKALYGYRTNQSGATATAHTRSSAALSDFLEALILKNKYPALPPCLRDVLACNLFYLLYKQQLKQRKQLEIPSAIQNQLRRVFRSVLFVRGLPIRKKIRLYCPNLLYKLDQRIKSCRISD